MRRYRWTLVTALILAAATVAGAAGRSALQGDSGERAQAVHLPTACENFVEITALFAEQGSTAALAMVGGDVFSDDPGTRVFEILRNLLDACDAELASGSS